MPVTQCRADSLTKNSSGTALREVMETKRLQLRPRVWIDRPAAGLFSSNMESRSQSVTHYE